MSAPEPENSGLSPVQQRAILALLVQSSTVKAAESVDVHELTLRRWMKEPAFKAAYEEAQRESFAQGMALLVRYLALAVNTLAKTMTDERAPFSAKVSAAGIVLKQGRESIELGQVVQRVETLEQQLKDQKDRGTP